MKEQEDVCLGSIGIGIKCPHCHQFYWYKYHFGVPPYIKEYDIAFDYAEKCPFCHKVFMFKYNGQVIMRDDDIHD